MAGLWDELDGQEVNWTSKKRTVSDAALRIQAYRRLAEVTTRDELQRLEKDWRDRFGALPEPARNLLTLTEIKLAAARQRITRVETRENKLMLTRGGDFILVAGKFPRLVAAKMEERLNEIVELLARL